MSRFTFDRVGEFRASPRLSDVALLIPRRTSGRTPVPRLIRDRGSITLRAVTAQKIAVAVEIHHRVGDFVRAVPRIEIEHLVVLTAAVLAISPKPQQDIGLFAAQMIFEEFGRASAIEDGAVQEVAAFGFDAVLLRLRDAHENCDRRYRDQPRAIPPRAGTQSRAGGAVSARSSFRRWRWICPRMCPSPQHAAGLSASGVTSLRAVPSFLGDFLELVSNAAIEYRFRARSYDPLTALHGGRSLLKPKTL